MEVDDEDIIMNIKYLLMNQNRRAKTKAISSIKYLLESSTDLSFIQKFFDVGVIDFLLEDIINLNYVEIRDVIVCLKHIIPHEEYFTNNYILSTLETIKQSIYFLTKENNRVDILIDIIEFSTKIYERLNKYCIDYDFYIVLQIHYQLLDYKNNLELQLTISSAVSIIISHKNLYKNLSDELFDKINQLFERLVDFIVNNIKSSDDETMNYEFNNSEMMDNGFNNDEMMSNVSNYEIKKVTVITICRFCINYIKFRNNVSKYYIIDDLEKYKMVTSKALENICLPYFMEANINKYHTDTMINYVDLLKYFYQNEQFDNISFSTYTLRTFKLLTDFLKKTYKLNLDETKKIMFWDDCLLIICFIMSALSKKYYNSCYSEKELMKYIYNNLKKIKSINVSDWINLLVNDEITLHCKHAIVIFCCYYYIHTGNLQELKFYHLTYINQFIIQMIEIIQIKDSNYFSMTKHLIHLFGIFYAVHLNKNRMDMKIASKNLQRIILDVNNYDNIIPADPRILIWTYTCTSIKREFQLKLTKFWLDRSINKYVYKSIFIFFVNNFNKVSFLLFYISCTENCKLGSTAVGVLQNAITNGNFKPNNNYIDYLFTNLLSYLNDFKEQIIRTAVIGFIRVAPLILNLISELSDFNLIIHITEALVYIISRNITITNFEKPLWYIFLKYVKAIMFLNYDDNKNEELKKCLSSRQFCFALIQHSISDEVSISLISSQILATILSFHKNYTHQDSIILDYTVIIKLISTEDVTHLLHNLKLLHILLTLQSEKSIVIQQMNDKKFIQSLFMYLINLLYQLQLKELNSTTYKCLEAIIVYFTINKSDQDIKIMLALNPSHHLLIKWKCRVFSTTIDVDFINYVHHLLKFIKQNRIIFNKNLIGSNFWKTSISLIAIYVLTNKKFLKDNYNVYKDFIQELLQFEDFIPVYFTKRIKYYFINPLTAVLNKFDMDLKM